MQKENLSTGAAAVLREWILDGTLPAGERLNEVHLAERLEVSRTPLREALGILLAEHFVIREPRRGFYVRPLSLEEFDQLYGMRPLLDPSALEIAGLPDAVRVSRLRALNEQIRAAVGDPARVIELDDAWHLELIGACPNRILIETIQHFMLRTRRYEHAYMKHSDHVAVALDDHEEIFAAIEAGDLPRACRGLRQNMMSAVEPLRNWLKRRNE